MSISSSIVGSWWRIASEKAVDAFVLRNWTSMRFLQPHDGSQLQEDHRLFSGKKDDAAILLCFDT